MIRIVTRWSLRGAILATALLPAARAEIGLEDPMTEETRTPPVIVVPDPERTDNVNTNDFLSSGPSNVRADRRGRETEEARHYEVRALPVPAPLPPDQSSLMLRSREVFSGELVGTGDGIVQWRHRLALEPLDLRTEAVEQITFAHPSSGTGTNFGMASLQLVNGDEMFGRLQQITGTEVQIEHPNVGRLVVRRAAVARIVQSVPGARRVYTGPLCGGEWRTGSRGERMINIEGGRMILRGENPATCAAGLPKRVRVDFDVTWGRNGMFTFFLHAASGEITDRGSTRLVALMGTHVTIWGAAWGGTVQLEQTSPDTVAGGALIRNEQMEITAMDKPGHGRFTAFASQPDHVVSVMMDGHPLKEWRGLDEVHEPGGGLAFTGDVTIERISVREWDGRTVDLLAAAPDQDTLMLANCDRLVGTLQSIEAGRLALTTAGGDMALPFDRVQEIAFATQPLETDTPPPSASLILMRDGGRIHLTIERLGIQELVGTHSELGRIRIPLECIQQIRFGVHEN